MFSTRVTPSLVRFSISFLDLAANCHIISTYYCHLLKKVEKVGVNWTRNREIVKSWNREIAKAPVFDLSLGGARTRRSTSTFSTRVTSSLTRFWVSFLDMTANCHIISTYYCHFVDKVEKVRVNWTRNREIAKTPIFDLSLAGWTPHAQGTEEERLRFRLVWSRLGSDFGLVFLIWRPIVMSSQLIAVILLKKLEKPG